MTELNNRYTLHNKLLITYKMIFPTKEPDRVEAHPGGSYEITDKAGESCLTYSKDGLLTATNYHGKVIFMCHVSSFSRFDNIWKIEQQ